MTEEKRRPASGAAGKAGVLSGSLSIVSEFRKAICAAGLTPPDEIIPDGKLHRFATNGRCNDDAGWYVLHVDGIPAGAFGDWRSGISSTWRADIARTLTADEEVEHRRRIESACRRAEAERRARSERAAALAAEIWKAAGPAGGDHPYLVRKGVRPTDTLREMHADELVARLGYVPQAQGEALQGRVLIAPVRVDGKLATLEMIDERGRKSALAGGIKKGGFWVTGSLPEVGRIVVAEGVATALSIAEALGEPVAAALSVGNLQAAGLSVRQARPRAELVIAADLGDDGKAHPDAIKAAESLGCALAVPDFGGNPPPGGDFNDLHQVRGTEAVRRCFQYLHGPAVELVSADGVEPEPVSWLWSNWIARGKFHLLAGRPGCGKTTLALSLAAAVSSGGAWPDRSPAQVGDVVVWSGEDDPADTLVPRLIAAGADRKRVHFVGPVVDVGARRPFDLGTDVPLLVRELVRIRPALLILDPVAGAVTGDSHKNSEVRRGLQPLVDLASQVGCAVLGISHLVKGSQGREPLERVLGSIAFAAVARVVLLAAKSDAEDGPPRILVRGKSNLGPDDGGVGYDLKQSEIRPGLWASCAVWTGRIEGDARVLLAQAESTGDDERSELEDAKQFLVGLLTDGPLPSKVVKSEADGAGYSWTTIRRAQKVLGVKAVKEGGYFGGRQQWYWRLPAEGAQGAHHEHLQGGSLKMLKETEDAQRKSVSAFSELEHLQGKPPSGDGWDAASEDEEEVL
jgi:putative DNA primase/helicase